MDTLKVMAAKRPVMTYEAHLTLQVWVMASGSEDLIII